MTLCLVTRAQPGAQATAQTLRNLGFNGVAVPAAIVQPTHAHIALEGVQALLMTSAAAARNAVYRPDMRDLPVYAVGDATAAAAKLAGYETVISAGGDGAALAVLAADRMDPKAGTLLHLRGQEVAGDVTGMLSACGFQTRLVEVYQTHDHPDFAATMGDYLARESGLILFHSPAGARRFEVLVANNAYDLSKWQGIGLSQACLTPLEKYGFNALLCAPRPDEEALIEVVSGQQQHSRP
jgi:uroporphyrinogen-III synthase